MEACSFLFHCGRSSRCYATVGYDNKNRKRNLIMIIIIMIRFFFCFFVCCCVWSSSCCFCSFFAVLQLGCFLRLLPVADSLLRSSMFRSCVALAINFSFFSPRRFPLPCCCFFCCLLRSWLFLFFVAPLLFYSRFCCFIVIFCRFVVVLIFHHLLPVIFYFVLFRGVVGAFCCVFPF